eukprot:2410184-Prymnesium_polylepis.1
MPSSSHSSWLQRCSARTCAVCSPSSIRELRYLTDAGSLEVEEPQPMAVLVPQPERAESNCRFREFGHHWDKTKEQSTSSVPSSL